MRKIISIFCCGSIWMAAYQEAVASVFQQEYSLTGKMSFTFSKEGKEVHAEKLQCKIFRNGDNLKITTSLDGSDYPVSVFVCNKTNAFTYVQYAKEAESAPDNSNKLKPWNKASVWASNYRIPKYMIGKLTPLWLMSDGNQEFTEKQNEWITVFGNEVSFNFYDQPKAKPEISVENFWPAGFSSYSETITIPNTKDPSQTFVQSGVFKVTAWTNYFGVQFPQSFSASIKTMLKGKDSPVSEMDFEFTSSRIEDAQNVEIHAPLLSQVTDMRLKEQGQLANGVSYRSSNGVIYSDPIKEHGINLVMAKGTSTAIPVSAPARFVTLFALGFVTLFPPFLWALKWWSSKQRSNKNKQNNT